MKRHIGNKNILIPLIIILVAGGASFGIYWGFFHESGVINPFENRVADLPVHAPLSFTSNSEMDTFFANQSGDGLSWDTAYRIEGYAFHNDELSPSIEIQNTNQCIVIENCYFEGVDVPRDSLSGVYALMADEAANIQVQNCMFYNFTQSLVLWDCNSTEVRSSEFLNPTIDGSCIGCNYQIFTIRTQISIDSCMFYASATEGAININGGRGCQIQNNRFEPFLRNEIYLYATKDLSLANNSITGAGIDMFKSSNLTVMPDNLINGYPLVYHENQTGLLIENEQLGQIILYNCNQITLRNMTLPVSVSGILLENCTDILIDRMVFSDFLGVYYHRKYFLTLINSSQISIQNSAIHNSQLPRFSSTNNSSLSFYRCNITGDEGNDVWPFEINKLVNFQENYVANRKLEITGVFPSNISNNIFIDSEISVTLENVTCENNYFKDSGLHPINNYYFAEDHGYWIIRNNTFKNEDILPIKMFEMDHTLIENNRILVVSENDYGYLLTGSNLNSHNIIRFNEFVFISTYKGSNTRVWDWMLIKIHGNHNSIYNNTFYYNRGHAVGFGYDDQNNSVIDNTYCGEEFIFVPNDTPVTRSGNSFDINCEWYWDKVDEATKAARSIPGLSITWIYIGAMVGMGIIFNRRFLKFQKKN